MIDSPGSSAGADYNRVLEAFVDESGPDLDIAGLVAYALYKRQKRDWIVDYKRKNADRAPTREEISAVTSSYLTPGLRETLRQRAFDLLSDYGNVYVEAATPAIQRDALSNEVLRQAQSIQRSIEAKSGFRFAVWSGIVSTALWTLLVAVPGGGHRRFRRLPRHRHGASLLS
ncbi:hypothetical protein [Aurantimonas sp. Leaf443]|uniref:hypothetical protein n=1 Tax=Aurantimonas sp. Leaf443 TaxID=1736378 RepID=UPI0006F22269|nr:hypothetical protein [Aurantimonas sp. Leaf443]KQT85566.1 hypothetical protein ASG48_10180 [Aurantimonas sp. Leaf443]